MWRKGGLNISRRGHRLVFRSMCSEKVPLTRVLCRNGGLDFLLTFLRTGHATFSTLTRQRCSSRLCLTRQSRLKGLSTILHHSPNFWSIESIPFEVSQCAVVSPETEQKLLKQDFFIYEVAHFLCVKMPKTMVTGHDASSPLATLSGMGGFLSRGTSFKDDIPEVMRRRGEGKLARWGAPQTCSTARMTSAALRLSTGRLIQTQRQLCHPENSEKKNELLLHTIKRCLIE